MQQAPVGNPYRGLLHSEEYVMIDAPLNIPTCMLTT